jgi:hypothetical protein
MASLDWSALQAQAAAEGYVSEILPDGPYTVKVASTKVGKTKAGDPSLGIRLVVVGGPHDGKSVWDNLNLTISKPGGLGMFFRKIKEYGVPQSIFATGGDITVIAAAVPIGAVAAVTLAQHEWNGKAQQDVNGFTILPAGGAAAAPVAQGVAFAGTTNPPATPGF